MQWVENKVARIKLRKLFIELDEFEWNRRVLSMAMDDSNEEDIISSIRPVQIPPQPQLLIDLEEAGSDLQKITRIVSADPSIAAAVIKTVNSPFFGMAKEITDILQANTLLGLNCIKNIINAVLIENAFPNDLAEKLGGFWSSTHDVAVAASIVAKQTKCCEANEAYLLGLFHNAGMPLMLQKYSDYLETLSTAYRSEADMNLTQLENDQYKANHAVVGYYISRTWHLPKAISLAIRDHHERATLTQLDSIQDKKVANLLAALKLGEYLAREAGFFGGDQPHEWYAIQSSVMEFLDLHDEDLINLQELVDEETGAA